MFKSKHYLRGFLIKPFATKILKFISATLYTNTKAINGKSNNVDGLLLTGGCPYVTVAFVDLQLLC